MSKGSAPPIRDVHFHLFVYGSLRSGARTLGRELLAECELVGPATVRGTLYDVGDYPTLLLGGDDVVEGEVWRCPATLLRVLDRYEGTVEGLFRRAAVRADGHACWVYVAGPRLGPRLRPEARIESGSWS
ncbi:MAG TPA: gamma-glutamylcyclotransferase family protein [Longimicrobiales bacterium]|nr:gamma-glutamylcyclotransferase family protein [Longimicrobiales bacterium]